MITDPSLVGECNMAPRRNLGYSISAFNTFEKVDDERLAKELQAKGVKCERPKCRDTAFFMIKSGVSAFICAGDFLLYHEDLIQKEAILTEIKSEWQRISTITASEAYQQDTPETISVFDGVNSLLGNSFDSQSDAF